jgi:hypothetical protein
VRFDHRRRYRHSPRHISAAASAGIPSVEEDLKPRADNLFTLGPPAVRIALTSHGWPLVWADRVALHPALYSSPAQEDPPLTLLGEGN